jgi:quinohemoprotein amine dehydrogenase
MSRISYRRATPENWQLTVERMISLNHAAINPTDARAIVKYLSDHNGLAPEEGRQVAFEAERRVIEYTYSGDADTAALCSGCHSIGRVMSERRTRDEWGLLVAMHRGYYPLVDNQPIAGGPGFRRSRALAADATDKRQPMDKAIEFLAKTYPLVTPEWTAWSAAATPASLAGRWAVTANVPGKGPAFGEMTITNDSSAQDAFATRTTLTIPRTGETLTRTGKGLVYTGFQWRGRGFDQGKPDDPWREVMFVERDRANMWGRWFSGAYDELGMDVKLTRITSAPVILGTGELSLKRGTTAALRVFGANLPTVTTSEISLGQGVRVTQVSSATASAITLQVAIAADAAPGPRDVSVAGTVHPSAFLVYDRIDGLQVLPRAGLARVGGVVFPKQVQQFEAMAYTNGPDGRPDTADDVPLGLVDARWSVEEYTATYQDDDVKFVGAVDARGLFTPNNDGPNPERPGNRNNVGDVWVVATYTPEGASEPLRGRAHLLVTVPIYMRWMTSEAGK